MDKIQIEMSVDEYKYIHLILYNIIELTENKQEPLYAINKSLKTVKSVLETK